MYVSWNWLKDYVPLEMTREEFEHRLAMSGLNVEGSIEYGSDWAVDLEVTSNRPDCLGHIGVAREIAVLWDNELKLPDPQPTAGKALASDGVKIRIDCPELCYRYTARLIRGVKIGPSPDWLVKRLEAIGVASVNNVVDISNYVLFESGQPLHAFDFATIQGGEIIVRAAKKGEKFTALDHKEYELTPEMCVIADTKRAIALGGVMGGENTEISDTTTDVLVESAEFNPIAIRTASRALNLHSPSSYRFERRIDPEGVAWANNRCCEMILDVAGGELAEGIVDVGRQPETRDPITLRLAQVERLLGIIIPGDTIGRILKDLGLKKASSNAAALTVTPPSWRGDLTREVDLIEEVARIYGYEEIPENVAVPMAPSHRTDEDRVIDHVRSVLNAAGFDEALTASAVITQWSDAFSPWTDEPAITSQTPMLRGANCLRRSLVPSLLGARRINESLGNTEVELFESAKVYLPRPGQLPQEDVMVTLTSGQNFHHVKGVIEGVVHSLNPAIVLEAGSINEAAAAMLDPNQSCSLSYNGVQCGLIGQVSESGLKQFELRRPTVVAEVRFETLEKIADLIPQHKELSTFPAINRDVNLIVDESVHWASLAATVTAAGGELVESVDYRETFRNPKKDGAGKKRIIFSFTLRSPNRTLTGDEADAIFQQILQQCQNQHKAELLS